MLLGIGGISRIEGIKYDTPDGWEQTLEPFQLSFWGVAPFVTTDNHHSGYCTIDLSKDKLLKLKKIIDDLVEKDNI